LRKGDARKKRSKLTYILPIFVLLLIGIGCLGLSKSSNNINKENDKIEEMATGYMSEEIEKLKNEDDENLISKEYLVTDNVIKKVKENTSIEEFKKSFEREVKVYTDEAMDEEITDGIIKTGMTVADKEDTYIAVVDGDVSKDGKVDQIDISKMIRQETDEIGKVEASAYGIEKVARKIVYGEYELEKVKEVEKPEIKVVNGQQGENEWYTTDVELEINQKEEQGKRTVYKIKGTEEKEETQIEEGQKITIDKDGIYKVIAYTYGEEGNKSRITYEIIKVNKTGIEATINYSTTESTTDPVIATVTFNKEGITITNNEGKNTYEFTDNGEFTFEYVDEAGRTGSITAKVDWIKKKEIVGQDGEWKYFVNSDNTIQLTQYLGTKTELVVPANYDGYEVYAVGAQGLEESTPSAERINVLGTSENATITKLTIEEGIKEIKCSAFEKCTGIKGNLVIPDSVETIEGYAFNSCSGFNGTLTLPSTLKSIENRAFQLCSGFKDDLVIPEGIKSIGDAAFNKCTGFNGTLTLPSTLKSIGNGAFQYCSGLTGDILIPEGVETLGTHVFNKCTGFNGTITLPSTLKEIGRNSFYNCNKLTGNLVIPEGIEIINPNTFRGCSSLNGTLTLPSTLKEISNFAFYGCKNLKGDINIPDNVISIGDQAFYNCTGFDGYIRLSNKLESIGGWTFGNCSKLVGDLIIPDSVTNILDSTFRNCSSLNGKLVISNNITKLEEGVFSDCSNLVGELVIPAGVKTIGKAAFQQCEKLNGKLVLPEGLEYIGDFAFNKCTSFENTTIKIPASLKKMGEDYDLNGNNVGIGSHFFYNFGANVRKFETFEVENGNENFVAIDGVLYTKDLKRLVCYPRNKKDTTYEIQEGVELLDQMSIASNMTLQTLVIPDSLIIERKTYPGFTWENDQPLIFSLYNYNAIQNIETKETNPNYKSVDGVLYTKDLKELVYISSGRTKEVIIPNGVETIRERSIYWSQVARNVSKIYIPSSVVNISDNALSSINNGFIKKIEISEDNPSFTLGSNGKLIRK
jgi:hypothetical protein